MPKYNFYELKDAVRTRKLKELPSDVNQPVIDMLTNKLKCNEAVEFVKRFQAFKDHGNIQIFDKSQPKMIKITTNYGMIEGFDLVETIENERFIISASKHIKNDNLDMKKNLKSVNNSIKTIEG